MTGQLDLLSACVAPPARRRRPSLTDRLEQFFRQHPGEWVSVAHMADLVGHSGVRQRRLEVQQRGLCLERSWRGDALGWTYRPAGQAGRAA